MAIQISGCTVIDNSRNITNANNMCVGTGITMIGSSGNISIAGTLTAGGLDFPPSVVSYSPADGATGVQLNANIVITFNQFVEKATTGIGTTANITLRNSSGIGTVIQTIGINSTSVTINGSVVTINPPGQLPNNTNVFVVVGNNAFTSSGGNTPLINTYDFTTGDFVVGDSYQGGFLICKASPLRWVVSPYGAEVSRTWYLRTDANTRAQEVSTCTGWFVPTCGQLKNPGYCCRSFWDSYNNTNYWSESTASPVTCFTPHPRFAGYTTVYSQSYSVSMQDGTASGNMQPTTRCVRAFRCVTY